MIGTKLAQYEIIEELGRGGMATVYRAYQPRMDRYVAVKVIRQSIIEDTNSRERFQREARIIARLEHPHLLPIYDFDGSHDPPYIVMRYLEGGTLKEALANRPLPFEEISYLLRQVGSALDYAHRQGVIHRDIKPSNIMIDQEGNAFVMDFGIARMTGRDSADGGLTGTGTIIGTPDYMAPEQGFGSAEVDLRADIYSQGVMLFEMTTGKLPFKGKTPMETMLHHLSEPVPNPNESNPELPGELNKVITKAMAKDPADRYSSVVKFTADAVHVLGEKIASTPNTLQEAVQQSTALTGANRAEKQEQIEATMAEFAAARSGRAPDAGPSQQHRTVTALYVDMTEYNELVESEKGAEIAQRTVRDLWSQATEIVKEQGGAVFAQSDRDLLALWGAVAAHEDDPEHAVLSALAVRDALGLRVVNLIADDEPMPIRIGLNTGPALINVNEESGSYSASGSTVNLASRVSINADGLVLVTQETYRHIQGIFDIEEDMPLRLRRVGGKAQVNTYRINEVKPRAFRLQPRGIEGVDTQMVGRRAELDEIQMAYFSALEDAETQLVTVVGPAGIGKSRLLYEFAAWAELRPGKFFIFRGRATPAMTNRPYSLWRDILSFRFEILDSDSPDIVRQKMTKGVANLVGHDERLAHLMGYLAGFDFSGSSHLGGGPQDVAHQGVRAAVEFFHRLTERDAVVIQLEDIHHADDPTLDLLVEITSADQELPLLLLSMARPALFQRRPTWGSGQDYHIRVDLRPLSKRHSRQLVAEILQKVEEIPRELRDLLVKRAEGNPHYMEELVKMLVEDRVIQKVDQDRWSVETSRLSGLRVPPTLVSLLQARFDSLLYPEKLTLQRAAVVGRVFYDSAVAALDTADHTHIDDLDGVLRALSDREFVFPRETSAFAGSKEYIFGQAMMRDLILETLLENQASICHKAMAQWLSFQGGQRAGEYDGLIAEHYEKAGEYYLAAEYLAKAGTAAFNLGAYPDGIRSGEKALELLSKSEQGAENVQLQLKIQMDLADGHGMLGNYGAARSLLESVLENARSSGDKATEATALAHLGRIAGTFQQDIDGGRHYLEQALAINQELDDKQGLVFILRQLGNLSIFANEPEESIKHLKESLKLARELGDHQAIANALDSLGYAVYGSGDVKGALTLFEESLEVSQQLGDSLIEAMILSHLAHAHAELEDYQTVQELGERALAIAREANSKYIIASALAPLSWAAVASGWNRIARKYLYESSLLALELGNVYLMTTNVLTYAQLQGRRGEAKRALELIGIIARKLHTNFGGIQRMYARVLAEVGGELSDDEVEAALSQGADLELEELIREIIEETG